jgi:hypothetical protein
MQDDQRRAGQSPLDRAKERLTIPAAWALLGLPGVPKAICRSPFREDRKASFSISDDGKLFHDFATCDAGDIVAFVARAKKCSLSDAAREVIRLAGLAPAPVPRPATSRKTLRVPDLSQPTSQDLEKIRLVRHWPGVGGMEMAFLRGHLYACTMLDDGTPRRAWAITDSARRSVQVRRLDGLPWAWNGAKAWTLGGSQASWPIGTDAIADFPNVSFCAGGPDFLAGYGLAWLAEREGTMAFVCMPGESAAIHADALPHFKGKRVRIFEHADVAGANAGARWADQFREAGINVDGFTIAPPHKDLADVFAGLGGETADESALLFEGMEREGPSCH